MKKILFFLIFLLGAFLILKKSEVNELYKEISFPDQILKTPAIPKLSEVTKKSPKNESNFHQELKNLLYTEFGEINPSEEILNNEIKRCGYNKTSKNNCISVCVDELNNPTRCEIIRKDVMVTENCPVENKDCNPASYIVLQDVITSSKLQFIFPDGTYFLKNNHCSDNEALDITDEDLNAIFSPQEINEYVTELNFLIKMKENKELAISQSVNCLLNQIPNTITSKDQLKDYMKSKNLDEFQIYKECLDF